MTWDFPFFADLTEKRAGWREHGEENVKYLLCGMYCIYNTLLCLGTGLDCVYTLCTVNCIFILCMVSWSKTIHLEMYVVVCAVDMGYVLRAVDLMSMCCVEGRGGLLFSVLIM
jgi:hypothetical protein